MARLLRLVLPFLVALLCAMGTAHARRSKPKKPKPVPAAAPVSAPTGTIVVAVGESARPHARELARVVYQDPLLRPGIDEATAQVLSGGEAPADNPALAAHAAVVRALATTPEEEAQRRLAGSLGRELNARLVVLVMLPPAA